MPFQNYKNTNNAQGQLLAGISASATSLILGSGQGALFPSTFPFFIKIEQLDTQANNYRVLKREIVKVTNRVADTFTIVRSSGTCPPDYQTLTPGTIAFSFNSSDVVTQVLTAEQLKDIQDNLTIAVQQSNLQIQAHTFAASTGSSNAYSVTLSPAPTSYTTGLRVQFLANFTNTGSATLNVSGLGAKIIYKLGGTTILGSGDIASGMMVDCIYDGTNFEMQTPLAQSPSIDINGLTAVTTAVSNDVFVEYNATALANRKILFSDLKGAISKRGGDGSDGTLNGTADITITGSNNTLIVKNYSSISAGSIGSQAYVNDPTSGSNIILNMANTSLFAIGDYVKISSSAGSEIAQVTAVAVNVSITVGSLSIDHTTTSPLVTRMTKMTVTPTNCLIYIKVKGNVDLTNWVFDFIGKGGLGGGTGGVGTQGSTNFAFPGSGGGGGAYGGAPGAPTLQAFKQPPFALLSDYFIGCGSGGGGGASNQNGNPVGVAGGAGGGCVILEVMGNVSLGTVVTNGGNKQNFMFSGMNGGNNTSGSGAGGGGGGGSLFIAYAGTLTGTSTYNFSGGTGGTGAGGGPYPGSSGAGGCSMIATGTGCTGYNYVSGGTSGTAGNGGAGFYTFLQINLIV